ncbi:MAG: hypothetical protein LBD57_04450 [Endomicrobium sp.]|uniref:hypothetical protein n=1 Tax=Candidatus Endomicrobiellum cubanum TaxID=3242325 RepID=UPI0028378011|nr:hypothetical protein [Endomicrobium sp.]
MIEHARILFRNFSGVESKFNPAGRRNFCVVINDEMVDILKNDGWNIKFLQPREEDDLPTPYLQVSVSYNYYPPKIFLISSNGKTPVDENMVNMLDWAEFENVDLIIRPYNYEAAGRSGIKAYVRSMYITLVEDEFDSKYGDIPIK